MSENLPILKVSPEQQELLERIGSINPEALKPDGFESCVVGMLRRFCDDPLVLIDADKCIRVLMERDGMDEEEAREYFEFNTIGAWVGPGTPAFVEELVQLPTEAEEYLLKTLNDTWACLPRRCVHEEFNTAMSWGEALHKLKELAQEKYPEIAIMQAKKGMNILPLLVFLGEALCARPLAPVMREEYNTIRGWTWWHPQQLEQEPEEEFADEPEDA